MQQPSEIKIVSSPAKLEDIDGKAFPRSFSKKEDYHSQLAELQLELLLVQQAYVRLGKRAIIVFEGWDASGKGGVIRRLTGKLDSSTYNVHSIGVPTSVEQGKHYLYRFQTKLPRAGSFTIFDRSYYGRVLVERVEGFATNAQWQRAYQEINEFERLLVDDEVRVVKVFLHISPEEQLSRFVERFNTPHKLAKLTAEDLRNREKWPQYTAAINDMFKYTSTIAANWKLVGANDKKQTRLYVLRHIIAELSKGIDITPPPPSEKWVEQVRDLLGLAKKGK